MLAAKDLRGVRRCRDRRAHDEQHLAGLLDLALEPIERARARHEADTTGYARVDQRAGKANRRVFVGRRGHQDAMACALDEAVVLVAGRLVLEHGNVVAAPRRDDHPSSYTVAKAASLIPSGDSSSWLIRSSL
jgi:hypothetical protein